MDISNVCREITIFLGYFLGYFSCAGLLVMIVRWFLIDCREWRIKDKHSKQFSKLCKDAKISPVKDCGDGWMQCKCNYCAHEYLYWQGDPDNCTKCGVSQKVVLDYLSHRSYFER